MSVILALAICAALCGLCWLITKLCDWAWFGVINPACIRRLTRLRFESHIRRSLTRREWRALREELGRDED
jgi:hypothetical protein